jgi:hypothetical protein
MTDIGNTALIVSMVFAAATIDDKRITAVFTLIFLFISYLP